MKIIVLTIGALILFLGTLYPLNFNSLIFAQDAESGNAKSMVSLEMNMRNIQSISSYSSIIDFDTNFTVTGTNSNIIKETNLIKNTIIDNFIKSPTIGYIKIQNGADHANNTTLSNPFASKQQIDDKISIEFNKVIKKSENSDTVSGIINCEFGMYLANFRCSFSELLE
jgi:archaellum component FlaF (FlaF/FlaG flagellin family)